MNNTQGPESSTERGLFDSPCAQVNEVDYTRVDLATIATGLLNDLADVELQVRKLEEAEMVSQEALQAEFSI